LLELLLVHTLGKMDGVIPSDKVGLRSRRLDHFLQVMLFVIYAEEKDVL
jgi:hypothetical protein